MSLRRHVVLLALLMGCASGAVEPEKGAARPTPPPPPEAALDSRIPAILARDEIPAAVVVVGSSSDIVYRKAFGTASIDTVFDLASCTKVVGTTSAAMLLIESGRLRLDDRLGTYVRAFQGRDITIRELLLHRSGLPAYMTPKTSSSDEILAEFSLLKPGPKEYRYSCLNMISLARVVETVTGMPLSEFLQRNVFTPTGMKDTGYRPDPGRCAPTTPQICGIVHDPLARAYMSSEHQSGNAGLFSTGDDLARFCQALLKGTLLKPETVRLMFSPVPGTNLDRRGLGWDVFDSPPWAPGVGHTGFTGTLIWINPEKDRFLVLLTNRTYAGEKVSVKALREEVLSVVNR